MLANLKPGRGNYYDDAFMYAGPVASYFANDFGLLGLGVFMFAIGFLLSRVWDSVTIGGSFFGSALLVLFPLFFLFLPANNLVLGYLDTISYVIFCLLMWIFEGKKIRIK